MTDLTLVVTAHDETAVCGPTMRAADLAVEEARRRGYTVQPVIVLDAATEATTAYFSQPRFDHWERQERHEGDLGRVRNAVVPECPGRHIAFLDADDLVSENWLAEGIATLDAAAERGERAIAHPELTVVFDGARAVQVNVDQSSPLFTPHYLYLRHYYDSACMAPREAHVDVPYDSRQVPGGASCLDRQWTIESLEAGWRHRVVRDTIGFARRRDASPVAEGVARASIVRSLPAMAIDRVRGLGRD